MCRWMAYSVGKIQVDELLFNAKHNLIDQSMSSRSAETPTNGDGFGLGWYGNHARPGLFRSIRPAWNDLNLRDLATNIESHMFMAQVRATSLATDKKLTAIPSGTGTGCSFTTVRFLRLRNSIASCCWL